jgi:hypothetical protein
MVCSHFFHLYIACKGKVLSTYVFPTNFAGLDTTYAVTLGLAVKYQ